MVKIRISQIKDIYKKRSKMKTNLYIYMCVYIYIYIYIFESHSISRGKFFGKGKISFLINHCSLFSAKSGFYVYIEYMNCKLILSIDSINGSNSLFLTI